MGDAVAGGAGRCSSSTDARRTCILRDEMQGLLCDRARLRGGRAAARKREEGRWSAIDFRLYQLSKELRRVQRRYHAEQVRQREDALRDLWRWRDFAGCHRVCHLLARRGLGVRGRLVGHVSQFRPGEDEWKTFLALPGGEGGMLAQFGTSVEERRRLEASVEPLPRRGVEHIYQAEHDFKGICRYLRRVVKRRAVPRWSCPAEVFLMCLR